MSKIRFETPAISPQRITVRDAAALLHVSENTARGAASSGLIDFNDRYTVEVAARLPRLVEAEGKVALRLKAKERVDEADRDWIGYDTDMTADQLQLASDRWWHLRYLGAIIASGFFFVVRSSFIVGVQQIDQSDPLVPDEDDQSRVRFNAQLVAMRGSAGQPILLQDDSPYADVAVRAVGARLLRGGSGGPFSLVDGSAITAPTD